MPEEARNSPTCRGKKIRREHALEFLEEYEVGQRASEVDLDCAETTLAHLLVESWLRLQAELSTEAKAEDLIPDGPVPRKDENAA